MADSAMPERPKEESAPAAAAGPASGEGEGGEKLSKGALKKLEKEKAKAEKKARLDAEEAARKKEADANDVSKEDYGELPMVRKSTGVKHEKLAELAEKYQDLADDSAPAVVFRATVDNARKQAATLSFLVFSQAGNTIQAVVAASDKLSRNMVKFAGSIPTESEVIVHGVLRKPKEPVTSTTVSHLEVHITKLYILCRADAKLPLQVADAEGRIPAEGEDNATSSDGKPIVSLNSRLNNRTIDLKANLNHAIFIIKYGVQTLFTEFLAARGFIGMNSPRMLGAATEGGSSVFEIKYFNEKAYLAQSPQLYKQMMIAARFERVMEIGPIFRAENSNTARHLTEFTGLDLEMAFEEDYHEVVSLLEELMLFIFNGLRERYGKETELVRTVYRVEEFKLPPPGKVPRLHFSEGIAMLREAGEELNDFDDLSTPQEKKLGALVLEKYGTDFYVLDKFPLGIRPFYTMPADPDAECVSKNEGYSNSYDFFMRGQEIMSGAQRIHNAQYLEKRMREHLTPVDPTSDGLKDYVNAFKYGCPPHAGGGIGLERIVMLWLGLPNVRLASLFPRDPGRLMP